MQTFDDSHFEDLAGLPLRSLAGSTPVAEVMSRDVVCVAPEATLTELTDLLIFKQISGVPVVDANGHPLGVVSKTDVLRALGDGVRTALAADIMTPVTLAMPEHASVARAAALMAYERVHRVVILGSRGGVIGIVSTIDVLRFIAQQDGFAVP